MSGGIDAPSSQIWCKQVHMGPVYEHYMHIYKMLPENKIPTGTLIRSAATLLYIQEGPMADDTVELHKQSMNICNLCHWAKRADCTLFSLGPLLPYQLKLPTQHNDCILLTEFNAWRIWSQSSAQWWSYVCILEEELKLLGQWSMQSAVKHCSKKHENQ